MYSIRPRRLKRLNIQKGQQKESTRVKTCSLSLEKRPAEYPDDYRSPCHQEVSPPTNLPPSKVSSPPNYFVKSYNSHLCMVKVVWSFSRTLLWNTYMYMYVSLNATSNFMYMYMYMNTRKLWFLVRQRNTNCITSHHIVSSYNVTNNESIDIVVVRTANTPWLLYSSISFS